MTCQRCGQADNEPGVQPRVQVDHLHVRLNGIIEVFQVRLCQLCRSVVLGAIRKAVEPVGRAAA